MINGECAYACSSKDGNGNQVKQTDNGNSDKKVYLCIKENTRKTCPYVNNYCACPKYEPR